MAQVIIVGGGLAGLSAAHTLLERGSNVLLLDKQPSVSHKSQFNSRLIVLRAGLWVAILQRQRRE